MSESKFSCHKCAKVFDREWNKDRHQSRCRGKTLTKTFKCGYCNSEFAHASSKYRHLKTCRTSQEQNNHEATNTTSEITNEGVAVIGTNATGAAAGNNTSGAVIGTNTGSVVGTQNTTNVENHNSVTIITFGESIRFVNDHITAERLEKMFQPGDLLKNLKEYMLCIMNEATNRCVKKTSLKHTNVSAHVGNGEWRTFHDKEVFPLMVTEIANNGWENLRYKAATVGIRVYQPLLDDLEILTSYQNPYEYEDKRMRNLFKMATYIIRNIVVDKTKKENQRLRAARL